MSSRNLLNLALLIALAVLIALVIWEPGKEEPQEVKLTTLAADQVTRFVITRTGQADVFMEKEDGSWMLHEPFGARANSFKIESILRLLEAKSHAQYDLAGKDLKQYKLDEPVAVINFDDSLTIYFGGNDPINHHRYVRIDDTLHLITDTFYYQLAGKAHTFVDSALLAPESKLTGLELPGLRLELQDDKWQVTPQPENFSADSVTELIDAWQQAQAMSVEPYTAGEGGQRIRLRLRGESAALEFRYRKTESALVLALPDRGLQYLLPLDSEERLLRLPPPVEDAAPASEPLQGDEPAPPAAK
ncbi:MAG: DUF4340 domain-containing protein [Pseudomonadota bacterium]|nr:MAG: DUF4340 domain-containing protein [Pseudomonadota bacterium]